MLEPKSLIGGYLYSLPIHIVLAKTLYKNSFTLVIKVGCDNMVQIRKHPWLLVTGIKLVFLQLMVNIYHKSYGKTTMNIKLPICPNFHILIYMYLLSDGIQRLK